MDIEKRLRRLADAQKMIHPALGPERRLLRAAADTIAALRAGYGTPCETCGMVYPDEIYKEPWGCPKCERTIAAEKRAEEAECKLAQLPVIPTVYRY